MNYTKYSELKPVCLPSVDTVNQIRQKYYPGMPAIEATKDAVDSTCEPGKKAVTKDQLDDFVYMAADGDPNDPNDGATIQYDKALQKHEGPALIGYLTGTGEVGKYERLMDDVAVSTKNQKTGWFADRIEAAKPVIEYVKKKVVEMWTKFTNWIKSIFE
jgi:hypothetical protein